MAKYILVSEYAVQYNINERKLRRDIKKGLIPVTLKKYQGKDLQHIIIDDENINVSDESDKKNDLSDNQSDYIKNVEIVSDYLSDSVGTNLVTMESATFEQLIEKITKLSDDRASTDKAYIERLEQEVHELRADNKRQNEEIKQLIRDSALLETELNITKIEVIEKDKKIADLESQLNNNFWNKL